jgi:long-subunit acyl-CoA synthetase (AMP-forming)
VYGRGEPRSAGRDGYLTVVDRKKKLIINAGGKNMSPANIENVMKAACPLIGGMLQPEAALTSAPVLAAV